MSDQWEIRATTFGGCNCDINCGCQFNVPTSHGFCNFINSGTIDEGQFNGTPMKGVKWAVIFAFPGEIAEGNGRRLMIIDADANDDQKQAMEKIVSGDAGEPGSTHFAVFGSVCTEFLETQFAKIELEVDIESRVGSLKVPSLIEATGKPQINVFDGEPFHIAIVRPTGSFEYTYCELGRLTASVTGPIEIKLEETYGQFCTIHYDQNGIVKAA